MKMVRVGVDDGRTGCPLVDGGGGRLEAGAPRVEADGSIGDFTATPCAPRSRVRANKSRLPSAEICAIGG